MENKNKEEIDKILQECQKQKDEYLAGWQRSRADFLNYKKEEIARIEELVKYANEGLILEILPALDSLDKAGFEAIKNQFQAVLKRFGVEEIKTAGQKFDPNLHEVVESIEKKGEESGKIIEEVKKGYILNGRVIRPASVKIIK